MPLAALHETTNKSSLFGQNDLVSVYDQIVSRYSPNISIYLDPLDAGNNSAPIADDFLIRCASNCGDTKNLQVSIRLRTSSCCMFPL